jgi:hypothetical protein
VITVTAGPIVATTTGIDVITAATTTAMTDATTIIAKIATISVTTIMAITVTTSAVTAEMIGVMIDIARTTTTATTTIARSGLNRHHLKGAILMVCFRQLTKRSTSSSVVTKRPKATGSSDQTQGRSGMSTLKLHNHCVGRSSQSLSPGKIIGFIFSTPGPTRWSLVDGAFLPKTLIDGGNNLNIIFTEMLQKMNFDFNKMTACNEPFYGIVPDRAEYPIGRVCLPVTFGTKENFRTEYLTFEVADFHYSYHTILGRPMLAKFMATPHHTYLIMKTLTPNGILSVLGDIMVSYNCESATVELSKDSAVKAAATVMVAQAAKIDQTTLEVQEQKRTSTALDLLTVYFGTPSMFITL